MSAGTTADPSGRTAPLPPDTAAGGSGPVAPGAAGHPRSAAAIAVVSWSLAVLASGMLVLARPGLDETMLFLVVDLAVACVYGTVSAVILSRRSHPVAWLLALAATGGGVAAAAFAYRVWATRPGGPPPSDVVEVLHSSAWVPGTLSLFLVIPWLVRDHPLGRARAGLVLGVAVTLAATLAQLFYEQWLLVTTLALAVALGLVSAAAVAARSVRGPEEERNGLGWLAWGTAVLTLSFVPVLVPAPWLPFWLTPVLHLLSQTVFPAAVLVAVLRNRMWGLRLVVSRAVLAGLLGALLLGSYLALSVVLGVVLPGEGGVARLIAAGAVVVAVQPARIVLSRRVNRLVYGEAADPDQVVRRLGSQLVGTGSVEQLLAGVTEDIGRSMRLQSVAVAASGVPVVGWGRATDPPTEVPLRHRGEQVGILAVTPRPGESLSSRDLRTLAELSSVVAAAVAVARAAGDLEELRARLSRVRLEERRVVRREIHDGLGPTLAGVSLGLQGVRNLLATDPVAGASLLADLQQEVEVAVAAVRRLSHHLLPPVLDELGLGPALAELAARYDGTTLCVTVEAEQVDGLAPQVAAAAYGIASEATTNVARHARATRCTIRATRDRAGRLVLSVTDDGIGIPDDAEPGVGSRSMRERAAEQGGTLEIRGLDGDGPPRGTEVRAVLPLAVTRD